MAREKQIDQEKKQETTARARPAESQSEPASERERSIETGLERGRGRSMEYPRPYSVTLGQPSSPFSLMRRLAEDMDRLFDQFAFGRQTLLPTIRSRFDEEVWNLAPTTQQALWVPEVELIERGDKIVVRADLPGLKKEDVTVEVDNGVLTITGERKQEEEEKREGFYRSERSYGRFYRAIALPEGVDGDQSDASFTDGVLEVSFNKPKLETRKAKRVQIR